MTWRLGFGASCIPTVHVLAHLRIAGRSVAPDVARFATGLPCSALTGRDSHPLDDVPHFYEMTITSFLADQPCLVALVPFPIRSLGASIFRRLFGTTKPSDFSRLIVISLPR